MHQQIRSEPKASTADVDDLLERIRAEEINILGVTGSDIEIDGEIGFMLDHADVERVKRLLEQDRDGKRYATRVVEAKDGLYSGYVEDRPGGLLDAILQARDTFPSGAIRDIAIAVEPEVRTEGGKEVRRFPIQIFFIVPKDRRADRRH
jgi:hypothetical protein